VHFLGHPVVSNEVMAAPKHSYRLLASGIFLIVVWLSGTTRESASPARLHEQTNFQNITEISILPSSFWYFTVTANRLLLGAHVLIVMGVLQIYIDDDATVYTVNKIVQNGVTTLSCMNFSG